MKNNDDEIVSQKHCKPTSDNNSKTHYPHSDIVSKFPEYLRIKLIKRILRRQLCYENTYPSRHWILNLKM